MVGEFQAFIRRGNVVDLAVGVVIGGAFGKIVSSAVDDLLMPPIGYLLGGRDFSHLQWVLGTDPGDAEGAVVQAAIRYGHFVQTLVDFLIVAFAVFICVKAMNRMQREETPSLVPPPPSASEQLLTEIRDLLRRGR